MDKYSIRVFLNGRVIEEFDHLTHEDAKKIYFSRCDDWNQYTMLIVNGRPKKTHEARRLFGAGWDQMYLGR